MPHQPEFSRGSFPVRFDDGFWEVLDVSYVTTASQQVTVTAIATARPARKARRVAS